VFNRIYMAAKGDTTHERVERIHFVGIGGSGMSGVAEVLVNLGFNVSGSDLHASKITSRLEQLGIDVFIGHKAINVNRADVIVISSAVQDDNAEVIEARSQRIPVVQRAEMLAELMRFRFGIAVAGTHGKTTTTSLIASVMGEDNLDPTFVVGGLLNSVGSHARLGTGRFLVAEADESDASFLYLQPMLTIVTNIDADHMATYGGEFAQLTQAFVEFIHHLPFYGLAVLCIDDDQVRNILPDINRSMLTYGFSDDADIRAYDLHQVNAVTHFKVASPKQAQWLAVSLQMPGEHNVCNALAAIAVAYEIGISDEAILRGLGQFAGIRRRFEIYGKIRFSGGTALLVDDYAHHPCEIKATVKALRAGWPQQRVIVVFQPHRYTRTRDLFTEFTQVLSQLEVLLLLEIYSAGEPPIDGVNSFALAQAIGKQGGVEPVLVDSLSALSDALDCVVQDDDIVLVLGAGDIGVMPAELMGQLAA